MDNLVYHARRMVKESDMGDDAKMEVLDFLNLDDILALKEYRKLEEQGLLYKLPLKVGDTVYTPLSMSGWYLRKSDSPYKAKVVFIGLNDSKEMGGGLFNVVYEKRGNMMQFNFSDIGKTVFTSKEEVEKAFEEKMKKYE